jgi:hypothetical protein
MTLIAQRIRSLVSPKNQLAGDPRHTSACSGLVEHGGRWFVVSDDELCLTSFQLDPISPLQRVLLLDGELPIDPAERKSQKPDFEVLTLLPVHVASPDGGLLALGSGSKPVTRERGVCLEMYRNGILGTPRSFDLAPLYAPLRAQFNDLNIEGALFLGDTFRLLQRGNAGSSPTASISYAAHEVLVWLMAAASGRQQTPPTIQQVKLVELESASDVPLTITDAAPVIGRPDLWVVSAVAEDTNNSYTDGPCVQSAIAFLNANDDVLAVHSLQGAPKVEGLVATVHDHDADFAMLTMVTDADDPQIPSQVLRVRAALPR